MLFTITTLILFNRIILNIFLKNFIILFQVTITIMIDKIDKIKKFSVLNNFAIMQSVLLYLFNFLMLL